MDLIAQDKKVKRGKLTFILARGIGTAFVALIGFLPGPLGLALFNLIPGFPLDGGRVLRAIVWSAIGDAHRSTRIAAGIGQAVAVVFIAFGFSEFIARGTFNGLWMAFIGWFMLETARATYVQVTG